MKTEAINLRMSREERDGFQQAADISGLCLSAWIRERLRWTAIRELQNASRAVPFVPPAPYEKIEELANV